VATGGRVERGSRPRARTTEAAAPLPRRIQGERLDVSRFVPSGRSLGIAFLIALGALGAWVGARETGVFAVRTVDGITRSLGEPKASIVVLPGPNTEVVITVAWEISWYQYRVSPGSPQPVRLAERGLEPGELDSKFADWNARVEPGAGILPDIENSL